VAGGSDLGALNQLHAVVTGWGHLGGLNQFYVGVTCRSYFANFDNLHSILLLVVPQIAYSNKLDAQNLNRCAEFSQTGRIWANWQFLHP